MASLLLLLAPAFASVISELTATPSSANETCYSFQCDYYPTPSEQIYETCVRFNSINGTFLLNPCKYPDRSTNFCPGTVNTSTTANCQAVKTTYSGLYPGDQCASLSECNSFNCTGGVCQCMTTFDPTTYNLVCITQCSQDSECVRGQYCNSTCVDQLGIGEAGCSQDQDCVNSAGCDISPGDSSGTCVVYFSLANGKALKNCEGYASLLCQSGQCANTTDGYECVAAFESGWSSPVTCLSQADCGANTTYGTLYSDCQCGYNAYKLAYCSPFLGDQVGQNYLTYLKAWTASDSIQECSTAHRFNQLCQKNWDLEDYERLVLTQNAYQNYSQIQLNDPCVKKIYTYQYWDLYEDVEEESSAGVLLGVLAMALLGV